MQNQNCQRCDRPDSADDMVACDVCEVWIHYQCAGVTESIAGEDRSFRCEGCNAAEKAKEDANSTVRSSVHGSQASKRSTRVELALQKLEEERALRMKQIEEEEAARRKKHEEEEELRKKRIEEEERYLKQKYDILAAEAENLDDGGSRKSKVSSRVSRERVREWLGSGNQSNPVGKDAVNLVPGHIPSSTAPPTTTAAVVPQNPAPSHENSNPATGTPIGRIHRPVLPNLEAMLQGDFTSTVVRASDPITGAYGQQAACTVATIADESLNLLSPGGLAAYSPSRFDFSSPAIFSSTAVRRTGSVPITRVVPEISLSLPVTTVAGGAFGHPPVCRAVELFKRPVYSVTTSTGSNVATGSGQIDSLRLPIRALPYTAATSTTPAGTSSVAVSCSNSFVSRTSYREIPSYWEMMRLRENPVPISRTDEGHPYNPVSSSEQRFLGCPASVHRTESDGSIRQPVRTLPYGIVGSSAPVVVSSAPVCSSDSYVPRIPSYWEMMRLRENPAPTSRTDERRPYNPVSCSEQRFLGCPASVLRSESDGSIRQPVRTLPYGIVSSSAPVVASSAPVCSSNPVVPSLPRCTEALNLQRNPAVVPRTSELRPYSNVQSSERLFRGDPVPGFRTASEDNIRLPVRTLPYDTTSSGVPVVISSAPVYNWNPADPRNPAYSEAFNLQRNPAVIPRSIEPLPRNPVYSSEQHFCGNSVPVFRTESAYVSNLLDPSSTSASLDTRTHVVRSYPYSIPQLGGVPRQYPSFQQQHSGVDAAVSSSGSNMNPPQVTVAYDPVVCMPQPAVSHSLAFDGHPQVRQIHDPVPELRSSAGAQGIFEQPPHPQLNNFVRAVYAGPSAAQLAARQVMPRELPIFSGEPQDWPLFISSFCNSTNACGYTDAENLARLQRCLKGAALESVKSRLLIPESVPYVMDILQRLFGRSEVLMHSLLNKLRSVPPPRAENLQSLITFGMAVQNVVDHMCLANLHAHLSNPMLLHELLEKLPSQLKMQWSCYKRAFADVNLATFGAFMSELVAVASDVTLPVDPSSVKAAKNRTEQTRKDKPTLFVHSEQTRESKESRPTGESKESRPTGESKESRPTGESKESRPTVPEKKTCLYCSKENHEISTCSQFKGLDLNGRWSAIRQKSLCKSCLIPHRKWPCRSAKECGVGGCKVRHHALLHSTAKTDRDKQEASGSSKSTPASNVALQNHHYSQAYSLFRYLPVTVECNGKTVSTYAFLDDGSTSTLLEAAIATELGLTGPSESLWLGWTGNISREEKESKRVSVVISGANVNKKFKLHNVRTVQKLRLPSQTVQYEELEEIYPHLKGLPVQSYTDATPRLIIGLEHVKLLTTLKAREGRDGDPVATKTRLGWSVFGRQTVGNESLECLNFHSETTLDNQELYDRMKHFFALEEVNQSNKVEAECDRRAKEILESTTRRVGTAFETGLLWKYEQFAFPDSYPMAVHRLKSLERRLSKDPQLAMKVKEQISEYEAKGYARKVTTEELESTPAERVWYLPLGVVTNPKKPNKVRLIWDAAARVNGVSLNDVLLKGPDMLTSLPAVLQRFRQRNIALCGDIKEMFHQIKIRQEDMQSQRFLWRNDPEQRPQVYVMNVATFGATCSPSSAQFVKNRNALEHAERYPKAARAIVESHYVDDYLDSVDTAEEAVDLMNEVKFVHAQAGFHIRNFSSNSMEVLEQLGEQDCRQSKSMNLDSVDGVERVLGMVWKPAVDVFTFESNIREDIQELVEGVNLPTKRQILKTIMSLFDPLGFVAHFVVHGKMIMQDIWRAGTDWDDEIPAELVDKWHRWSRLLAQLDSVRVPRCFFSGADAESLKEMQIHVFVDASEGAYACVAYLRIVDAGIPRCALVAARTKVAPLKPISIPRLELQAALLGTRLLESIGTSLDLPISKRFLWTDSSTVLAWIRSDSRRYHQFVAVRIGEILSVTSVNEWRHVPSKHNVADLATKWGSGPSFDPEGRWFQGPEFLYRSEDCWPAEKKVCSTGEELRSSLLFHSTPLPQLVDVTRFSKWNRMLRATAYVFQASQVLRKLRTPGILSTEELLSAENLLWRQVQHERYPDEYAILSTNKTDSTTSPLRIPKSSPLYSYSPFLDDEGVIRMGSRIESAPNVSYDTKYPVLLPKDHRLTTLLVDSYHQKYLHSNSETVFNEMRQRFRIPNLRAVIKKVSKDCCHCQVTKATPQPPMMAPLPRIRLTPFIRPFTHTGLDYFGPILVRQGRSLVKRWIALFTCLTMRAVYVEVVHSLSTESCIMAIRKFVGRKGAPETIYSDNGTNFRGADNVLEKQIQQINEECAATFTNTTTSWFFNPPLAPHMGGPWERLVRSVKAAMAAIADHVRHPTDEVLGTVVVEAESVVNSRPLTYVPLETSEQEALTPNHFLLYGTSNVNQPATPLTADGTALRDSWRLSQHLVDLFWKRWVHEYLPTLTRRTKWFEPVKPLQPGDLVIVIDENKRNGWQRGRIVEVVKGTDGQVRRAVVQTAKGLITRPAVKLALLDIRGAASEPSTGDPGTSGTTRVGGC